MITEQQFIIGTILGFIYLALCIITGWLLGPKLFPKFEKFALFCEEELPKYKLNIKPLFKWHELDVENKRLYLFVLPMLGLVFELIPKQAALSLEFPEHVMNRHYFGNFDDVEITEDEN